MHEEIGLKFDPHPLHEPLLYILLDQVTYCIKAIVRVYLLLTITTNFQDILLEILGANNKNLKISRLITDER